jgi:SAM-dependent methyltransferase
MSNPWLLVPAADYEAHMSSPGVGQLAVLDELLAEDLARFTPESVAVIGCGTGTGFGHIDPKATRRVVGIDLHAEYLEVLRQRYGGSLPGLELICGDLLGMHLEGPGFALVHVALVLEYVPLEAALDRIAPLVQRGGILTAVLQLPSPHSEPVTRTAVESVRLLAPILRLVDPELLLAAASARGLQPFERRTVPLKQGKAFQVVRLRRP